MFKLKLSKPLCEKFETGQIIAVSGVIYIVTSIDIDPQRSKPGNPIFKVFGRRPDDLSNPGQYLINTSTLNDPGVSKNIKIFENASKVLSG